MKMFLDGFGMVLIILGILSASGAAGDCDGNCMENANSIGFMLIILFGSLCACLLGGCLLYTSPSPRDLKLSRMPSSA